MPSKSLEKKLDKDFLQYLSLTKTLFDKIVSEDEKSLCEAWLKKLCGTYITTVSGKRDRNIYFSRLLLQMQDGKLKDIFLSAPPSGELEPPYTVFGLPRDVEDLRGFEEMGYQLDNEASGGTADVSESSRDGRTYLATREIKNGMMAYLAVTITEDEPLWLPQQARTTKSFAADEAKPAVGRFIKRLAQFDCIPLCQLRRSPEKRERVLEWMDNIIDGCNKWLRGEDPHNADLETLFEWLYEDYRADPEKADLFNHPKRVRDVLMNDIREIIKERRAEVSKRELILDQYEADEYVEEKYPPDKLDGVWRHSAKKPMKIHIMKNLSMVYPPDVIDRFFKLLVLERILIIEKGEKYANRRIAEMKCSNIEDLKKEYQRLAKLKEEYKEYYCIYKEAEALDAKNKALLKKSQTGSVDKDQDKKVDMAKLKGELENEIEGYRHRYEREKKNQGQLVEQLEEVKEEYYAIRDKWKCKEERLKCQMEALQSKKQKLQELIDSQKKRLYALKHQLQVKNMSCASNVESR